MIERILLYGPFIFYWMIARLIWGEHFEDELKKLSFLNRFLLYVVSIVLGIAASVFVIWGAVFLIRHVKL